MTNLLHSIKVYLYKNMFTEDADTYTARVATERMLDIKEICESAVTRGEARIPASSMQYAVELFLKEMEYKLCDGYSVNTGSFIAMPSVKGVFHSSTESFNPEKHKLSFRFKQGESLQDKLPAVNIQIMGAANNRIYIDQVTDLKSGSVNDLITPRCNLRINGRKLKLAGEHPEVGVCFINVETGVRTRIEKADIITNFPSELIIVIPSLEQGSFLLEITSQFTTSGALKQPNTATFKHELRVL